MLSLELDAPQIYRGAFLRLVEGTKLLAEVRSSSSTATSTSCQPIRISLPSSVDVTKILQPCGTDHGDAGGVNGSRLGEALSVKILGYDGDVIFPIGTAVIEIPRDLRPIFDQGGDKSSAFCAVMEDDTGSRVGTLSGTFLSRQNRDAKATLPKTQEETAGISASARGTMHWEPRFQEPPDKDNDTDHSEDISRKAIDLLEEASNILNSGDLALRQEPQIVSRYGHDIVTSPGLTETEDKDTQNTLTQGAASSDQVMHKSTSPTVLMNVSTNVPTCPMMDDQDPAVRVPTAGFRFEPTTGSVNWQRVATVNVSNIEREGNLQAVKRFIPEVAVGRVNSHDVDTNPGLLNAFRLAQLQVQYVLHCQQILQDQYNGLQSAVSNMKLEVEKNTRSNKAMRDRIGLLRRESREQDKIINSYSAILRVQNPELAAKVRLDDKGRLRVFNIGEATREWERRRHRQRHHRGRRDSSDVPNSRRRQPETEDVSNEGKTTTNEAHPERFAPLNGRREVDFYQVSPKALTTAGTVGALEVERGRIEASSSTAKGPRRLHEGPKMDLEEAFALTDVHRNQSDMVNDVRGIYPRGDSVTDSGESETDVRKWRGMNNQCDSGDGKASDARNRGMETSSEYGNKQAASPPGIGGSKVELRCDAVDRTPRIAMVKVKPRRSTGEMLTSPMLAEGNTSACLQDKTKENVLCSGAQKGYVASSGAALSGEGQLLIMEAPPSASDVFRASSRTDRTSVSLDRKSRDGFRDDASSGNGINSAAAEIEGNERVSMGTYPAKTASQLGLDEEGLPNSVVEFDLDDISEIDVGGEWMATGGGDPEGSVSS